MHFVVNKQEIFKQIHLYSVLQGVSTIVPELYSFQKKNAYFVDNSTFIYHEDSQV